MNIRLIVAVATLLIPVHAGAETRTFTNTAGKKIEAELVGMEDGTAVLKLGNGREAKVPLNSLSEADQTYVKTWYEENKDKVSDRDVSLTIDKNSKRGKTSSSGGGGRRGGTTSKSSKSETTFTCTLKNSSTRTIKGITASYTIYKRVSVRDGDGSETFVEEITGTAEVPTLPARGSVDFTTDMAECVTSSKKGGRKGPSSSKRESITGFVVALSAGGREFLKQSHPENYLERLEEEAKRKADREKDRR